MLEWLESSFLSTITVVNSMQGILSLSSCFIDTLNMAVWHVVSKVKKSGVSNWLQQRKWVDET